MDDALEHPSTIMKSDPSADGADAGQSSDEDDGGPDWTRLAAFAASSKSAGSGSRPVIPKRGNKEFEPTGGIEHGGTGTNLQQHKLARAREAMFSALDVQRTVSSKTVSYAVWLPGISRARVLTARGNFLLTMGYNVPRDVVNNDEPDAPTRKVKVSELLPEEALYLIERGSMLCYTHLSEDVVSGGDELNGAPMTVQQAFALMIGREDLSLEKYQVYAYLKRMGYTVARARALDSFYTIPRPHDENLLERRETMRSRLVNMLASPFWILYRLFQTRMDWWKPLNLKSWIHRFRSYHDVYSALRFIPHGFRLPLSQPPVTKEKSPYEIFFNVYKPSTPFRKTEPPQPDYSIVVVNARTTPMPSIHELDSLFKQLPELPPPQPRKRTIPTDTIKPLTQESNQPPVQSSLWTRPLQLIHRLSGRAPEIADAKPARPWQPHPYQMLKNGKKVVVVAAVDAGSISFFRFGQGAFDEWPMV